MKTELVTIDSAIPYEFNARKHDELQIDRIANSIKEFGFNQPIVIDESNIILVGHGRLLAARKLGLTEIPIVRKTGLTEAQKKAYRILDNKLQGDSSWEFENLTLDLDFLQQNEFDLSAWGLNDLALPNSSDGEIDADSLLNDSAEYLIIVTCQNELDQKQKFDSLKTMKWDAKLI